MIRIQVGFKVRTLKLRVKIAVPFRFCDAGNC